MNKAEELKQEFIKRYAPRREFTDGGRQVLTFIEKLDEYANEVSRESNKKEAILFLAFFMKETYAVLFKDNRDWEIFSIKWYNNWLKEQEE